MKAVQRVRRSRVDTRGRADFIRRQRAIRIVLGHGRRDTTEETGETARKSTRWRTWRAMMTPRTCDECRRLHGTIYDMDEAPPVGPPLHPNCECVLEAVQLIPAGEATDKGEEGADFWLAVYGELPDYYVTKEEAERLGWVPAEENLADVLPGRMIGGDVYDDREGKLPDAPGRVWYVADIDYVDGQRNDKRIVYSNDGLIFIALASFGAFIVLELVMALTPEDEKEEEEGEEEDT